MAFFKRSLPTGFVLGFATGLVARDVFPRVGEVAKPLSKAALKGSLVAFEKVREVVAHVGESLEDLASEVKAEMNAPATTAAEDPAVERPASEKAPARKTAARESKTRETSRHAS